MFWEGELVWGSYDLDTNPPTKDPGYANGFQNGSNSSGGFLRTDGDAILAIFRESNAPGEEGCRAAVAGGGSVTDTLGRNDYVCGRTPDGRLFRIHILGAGQAEVSGQVTVWAAGDTP